MDNLTMARKKMQSIDEKVVDLLNQRCLLSVQVGEAKQQVSPSFCLVREGMG